MRYPPPLQHPGISLRFFLAQPTTRAAAATWLPIIQVPFGAAQAAGFTALPKMHASQCLPLPGRGRAPFVNPSPAASLRH